MVAVERVAAAGVVRVPLAARFEHVIGRVVEPAEAERRPVVVALGGVVEDDVENHLDARPVQRLDHVAELVDRAERILRASCTPGAARRTRSARNPSS